jgi:EmrB/QacA subfamily drug resistance transporter
MNRCCRCDASGGRGEAVVFGGIGGGPVLARPALALALMVTGQFMVVLDFSIVNVALPTIERSLRFSAVGVEGVITAYATAFGGALILGGRLADLYGRRLIFLAGLLAFAVTSLACAAASSPALLIAGRIAQGLSAALLAPSALALLTTTFAEGRERNRALGIFGAATAAGFVCGQVLGGVLTDLIGWRSIFVINAPVAGVVAVLTAHAIRADAPPRRRRLPDIPGAALLTAAMALLVWAPTRGAERGWDSAAFLVPVTAPLLLLALFAVLEKRHHDPLVRPAMLRSGWLAGTNAATAVAGVLNGTAWVLCSLFLQQVLGYGPLRSGLAFIPPGLAAFLVATRYAGALITRFGVRAVLTVAPVISAVAIVGISPLPGNYLELAPALTVMGMSFVTATVATTVAVSAGVAAHEQGTAAAIRQTSFQIGGALGVAVLLSVAASHAGSQLAGWDPSARAGASLSAHATALAAGYRLALVILSVISVLGGLIALATLRTADRQLPGGDPLQGRREQSRS